MQDLTKVLTDPRAVERWFDHTTEGNIPPVTLERSSFFLRGRPTTRTSDLLQFGPFNQSFTPQTD